MSGEDRGSAPDGSGDLENLREKNDAGIFAWRHGPKHMGSHGSGGRRKAGKFVVSDDHQVYFKWGRGPRKTVRREIQ